MPSSSTAERAEQSRVPASGRRDRTMTALILPRSRRSRPGPGDAARRDPLRMDQAALAAVDLVQPAGRGVIVVGLGTLFSALHAHRMENGGPNVQIIRFDATQVSLRGVFLAQLAIGVLGVLGAWITGDPITAALGGRLPPAQLAERIHAAGYDRPPDRAVSRVPRRHLHRQLRHARSATTGRSPRCC